MIDNRFHELNEFVNHIESIFTLATHGTKNSTNDDLSNSSRTNNYKKRTKYLFLRLAERILEIYYEACEQHYYHELSYVFNETTRSFSFLDNSRLNSDLCLCTRDHIDGSWCNYASIGRQTTRTTVFGASYYYNRRYFRPILCLKSNTTGNGVAVVKHHIIPRSLIVKFFLTWLNNGMKYEQRNTIFYGCASVIFDKLKNSFKKILIVKVNRLYELNNGCAVTYDCRRISYDDNFF